MQIYDYTVCMYSRETCEAYDVAKWRHCMWRLNGGALTMLALEENRHVGNDQVSKRATGTAKLRNNQDLIPVHGP